MPKKSAKPKPDNHVKKHALTPEMEARKWKKGQSGNPKGRPKTHDQLRTLIQEMSFEQVEGADLNRLKLMLRAMFISKSPVDRIQLLEHGWGKVPQPHEFNLSDELKQKADELGINVESDPILAALFAAADATDAGAAPDGRATEARSDKAQ